MRPAGPRRMGMRPWRSGVATGLTIKLPSKKFWKAPVIFISSLTLALTHILRMAFISQWYGNKISLLDIDPVIDSHRNTISDRVEVKCFRVGEENCTGFFQYDGPDRGPTAMEIQRKEADSYTYGNENNADGHLIFFPNETNSESCIHQWGKVQASGSGKDRGMSSWREDLTIYETFFKNRSFTGTEHFYMEIGANDGVRESNSRFFDLCLGWNGLLVEPHPGNYVRMKNLRPNAHHLGMAPSCNASGMVKFPGHRYTNAVANEEGSPLVIHCGPLSYYLEQLGIRHINFWSLDVEGSELSILKTVDFDHVHIDVVIAESFNRLPNSTQLAAAVRLYMQQNGYLIITSVKITKSDLFIHRRICSMYNFTECW